MAESSTTEIVQEPDISFLSENVIFPLMEREDRSYSPRLHQRYMDEEEATNIPEPFIRNITPPLFRDFSKGKPNYNQMKNPDENIGDDFEIIKSVYSFVEDKSSQIDTYPEGVAISSSPNSLDTVRTKRALDYIFEICRRAGSNSYSEMEGVQITTPYDHQDLIAVTESEEVEFTAEEDVEALLEYGPDEVGFDDVIEGYDAYRRLNSRFRDRDLLNQVNPPTFTVFAEE